MQHQPFFKHVSSGLRARFRHEPQGDWLVLKLGWSSDRQWLPDPDSPRWGREDKSPPHLVTTSVTLSGTECPFENYIAWLEAIAVGCQVCAFTWDCEGPSGQFTWRHGLLEMEWTGRQKHPPFNHRISADRREVVAALYKTFRGFVTSSEYRPDRYENMSYGDCLVLCSGFSLEELIGQLLALDTYTAASWMYSLERIDVRQADADEPSELLQLFRKLTVDEPATPMAPYLEMFPFAWNGWPVSKRRSWLQRQFSCCYHSTGWFGSNLRAMRSSIVEDYLGWSSPYERQALRGKLAAGTGPVMQKTLGREA